MPFVQRLQTELQTEIRTEIRTEIKKPPGPTACATPPSNTRSDRDHGQRRTLTGDPGPLECGHPSAGRSSLPAISVSEVSNSPWKKSSMTFFHLENLRFSRVLRTRDRFLRSCRHFIHSLLSASPRSRRGGRDSGSGSDATRPCRRSHGAAGPRRRRLELPMADSIILAAAREHGATVWTLADFRGLQDVRSLGTE